MIMRCDRCHKPIPIGKHNKLTVEDSQTRSDCFELTNLVNATLCDKCTNELRDWIYHKEVYI